VAAKSIIFNLMMESGLQLEDLATDELDLATDELDLAPGKSDGESKE
jgi:hypothetical protein